MAGQPAWIQKLLDWLCQHYGIGCPKPPKKKILADHASVKLKQKE